MGARTPFDCCALSFQPFETPVCARNADGTGLVFELTNIIPWLKYVPFLIYHFGHLLNLHIGNITTRTPSLRNL